MPRFVERMGAFAADFGDAGVLAGAPVRVIFDGPGVSADGVSATDPQVQLPTASVPADYYGAALQIPQGRYTVREHLPDGTGWSLLLLNKAA
jgi:hypothetical protein